MTWKTSWPLVKDVVTVVRDLALTGTGLTLIILQSSSAHPSTEVLLAGLALTGVGATFHIGSLMTGSFGGRHSSSPSSSSSSLPPSHPGGDRE